LIQRHMVAGSTRTKLTRAAMRTNPVAGNAGGCNLGFAVFGLMSVTVVKCFSIEMGGLRCRGRVRHAFFLFQVYIKNSLEII